MARRIKSKFWRRVVATGVFLLMPVWFVMVVGRVLIWGCRGFWEYGCAEADQGGDILLDLVQTCHYGWTQD